MAQVFNHNACTTATYIGVKPKLQSMWDQQNRRWLDMIDLLPIRKMAHSSFSELHGTKVAAFLTSAENRRTPEWHGIKKCWMPLPNVVLVFPPFRYVPIFFQNNEISLE